MEYGNNFYHSHQKMVNLDNLIKQHSHKCHKDQEADAKQRVASNFLNTICRMDDIVED